MRNYAALMATAFSLMTACGTKLEPETDPPTEQSPDAGVDAGDPVPTFGEPIVLQPEDYGHWVWIPMPEMHCSNGSAGGFAVNFTTESRELLIYLQGGGICYDALTCAVGGAATNVGNDPIHTALDAPIRDGHGIFDRVDPSNPFRRSNFVVVPHCTGDHHTGNRVATYGFSRFEHVGYSNITHMLQRVVPTFADATRVVLTGFSAGGVGITANYHQLASAFESVGQPAPYLVIDAGPFMTSSFLSKAAQNTLRVNWGLDGTVGAFCGKCFTGGFNELYRVNAELHPGLRSSLVSTYDDSVVRLLYTVLNKAPFDARHMHDGLVDLADWTDANIPSTGPSQHRVFYYGGTRHGTLHLESLSNTPGLVQFLEGQLGSGAWSSVRP